MRRPTKHSYRQAGSFERIEEAALALAEADTDDDTAWHRARARLRSAVLQFRFERPTRRRDEQPEQQGLFPKNGR